MSNVTTVEKSADTNAPATHHPSVSFSGGGADKIYFPELDGLRFLAFLMVLLFHFVVDTQVLFHTFLQYFWAGVDLFFVLSAYLFSKLLTLEYGKWKKINFRKFYLRRIFRIWPVYYFYIAIVLLYYVLRHRPFTHYIVLRIITLCTFTDNLIAAARGVTPLPFSGHLWTIGFEEQFYLLVPITILLLARSTFKRRWLFYASVFVLFTGIRLWFISRHAVYPSIYVLPFTHFESILLGIILGFGDLDFLLNRVKPMILAFLGLFFFALLCLTPNIIVVSYMSNFTYLFVGISTALMVFSVTRSPLLKKVFSFRPFVYLGKRSYGLYVYHILVGALAMSIVDHIPALRSNYPVMLLLWLGITIAVAVVSYRFLEVPFLKLKKKFEVVESRPI